MTQQQKSDKIAKIESLIEKYENYAQIARSRMSAKNVCQDAFVSEQILKVAYNKLALYS